MCLQYFHVSGIISPCSCPLIDSASWTYQVGSSLRVLALAGMQIGIPLPQLQLDSLPQPFQVFAEISSPLWDLSSPPGHQWNSQYTFFFLSKSFNRAKTLVCYPPAPHLHWYPQSLEWYLRLSNQLINIWWRNVEWIRGGRAEGR